jgi:hypothetical protein
VRQARACAASCVCYCMWSRGCEFGQLQLRRRGSRNSREESSPPLTWLTAPDVQLPPHTPRVSALTHNAGPCGADNAIVLIHGWGGSRVSFARNLPALAATGCRVYALDLRHHGDSADVPPRWVGVDGVGGCAAACVVRACCQSVNRSSVWGRHPPPPPCHRFKGVTLRIKQTLFTINPPTQGLPHRTAGS